MAVCSIRQTRLGKGFKLALPLRVLRAPAPFGVGAFASAFRTPLGGFYFYILHGDYSTIMLVYICPQWTSTQNARSKKWVLSLGTKPSERRVHG